MYSNNSNGSRAASARGFMALIAITPLAALGILAGTVSAARAADTPCTTLISSGTINGNLVVPANAICTLANLTVTGNVQVRKGAILNVESSVGETVTIGGNIQAAQCNRVILEPIAGGGGVISVGGNVQIQGCTAKSGFIVRLGSVTINGNFACNNDSGGCVASSDPIPGNVRGNVQVNNNSGAFVVGNNVGGNVQVDNNSGSSATVVGGNTIGGNLQCARNTPGVTDLGVPNTVTGNKLGQCAGL